MKKQALQALFGWLCVSALTSCGSQRALHFAQRTTLDPNANTIKVDDKPIFKVSTSVLNLKEEQLALNKEALPKERAAYIASILKECHSDQDTIIAASPDFTLVKRARALRVSVMSATCIAISSTSSQGAGSA